MDTPVTPTWHAFLSHSHAGQGRFVEVCQRVLERIGVPWYRRRTLRLFRARSAMPYEPQLWPALEHALQASAHFVLFASPEAVRSPWVRDELRWWLTHRSTDRLVIVQAGGEMPWDDARRNFSSASTAVDPAWFEGALPAEPWVVDLRPHLAAAGRFRLGARAGLRQALLQVAARLHGRMLDEIVDADARKQRTLRIGLTAVAAAVAGAAVLAWTQYRQAEVEAAAARQAEVERLRALALELAAGGIGAEAVALMGEAAMRAAESGAPRSDLDGVRRWWMSRLVPASELLEALPPGQIFEWQGQVHLRGPAGLEVVPAAAAVAHAAYSPRSDMAYLVDREGRLSVAPPARPGERRTARELGSLDDLAYDSQLQLFELDEGRLLAVASRVSAMSYGAAVPTVRFFAVHHQVEPVDESGWDLEDDACPAVRRARLEPAAASGGDAKIVLIEPGAVGASTRPCRESLLALSSAAPAAAGLSLPQRGVPGGAETTAAGLPRLEFPRLRSEAALWQQTRAGGDPALSAWLQAARLADPAQGEAVTGEPTRQALAEALLGLKPAGSNEQMEGYAIDRIVEELQVDGRVRRWRRGELELILAIGAEGSKLSGIYTCLLQGGTRVRCATLTTLPPPRPRIVIAPDLRWLAVSGLSASSEPSFNVQDLDLESSTTTEETATPHGGADDFAIDGARRLLAVRIDNVAHVYELPSRRAVTRIALVPRPLPRLPAGVGAEEASAAAYEWRFGPSMCFALVNGLLIECTAEGNLRATALDSGALRWSRHLGGGTRETAPATAARALAPGDPLDMQMVVDEGGRIAAVRWRENIRIVELATGAPLTDAYRLPAAPRAARGTPSGPPWMGFDAARGLVVEHRGIVHRRPLPAPDEPRDRLSCRTGLQSATRQQPVDLADCQSAAK